jgi:hypothetical protein
MSKQTKILNPYSFKEKLYLFLICILFIVFFIPTIRQSLWIDETITYWVVKDGFFDLIHRAIHFQGQSPFYYLIVWSFTQILGHAEWVLRLPSLISLAVSCVFLYKLGLFFINREGGLISVLVFISLRNLVGQSSGGSCSARPYEFALMFSLLSVFYFIFWIRTSRNRYQIGYIITSVATFYAHILFTPIIFVHLCYFLMNRENGSNISFKKLFMTFFAIVSFVLPNIYQVMLLYEKRGFYSISKLPSVIDLIYSWFPRLLIIPLIAALLITRIIEKNMSWRKERLVSKQFFFFLIWFFCPALFLFAVSKISGTSIFLYHYYCWASPATALVVANILIYIQPERARMVAVVFFFMFFIFISIISPKFSEGWREAVNFINSSNMSKEKLVLAWPGLLEQRVFEWLKSPEKRDYLLAPFSFYSLAGKAFLLPQNPNKFKMEAILSENDFRLMKSKKEIYLIVRNLIVKESNMKKPKTSQELLEHWIGQYGFSLIKTKNFGGIVVSQFVFSSHS